MGGGKGQQKAAQHHRTFRNTDFWPHLLLSGALHLPAAPFVCQWAPLCVGVPVGPLCPYDPVGVPVATLCIACRCPALCASTTLVTSFACLVADGRVFRPCPQARGNKPQDQWLFAVFSILFAVYAQALGLLYLQTRFIEFQLLGNPLQPLLH